MRDKNSSVFISLLKLVNFNNKFGLLLNFFLCQDTSAKMFLSIHQNKFPPKFNFCVIRKIKFPPKFNFFVIRQITSVCEPPKFLPAKISSLKVILNSFRYTECNYFKIFLGEMRRQVLCPRCYIIVVKPSALGIIYVKLFLSQISVKAWIFLHLWSK